ncbi:MAG: HEAT repeat domain-containing protein [Candidatus Eisenbacteria bacterium]|uniref:HEAT repeat domain-containing protein n=1 Tax=Eiseniibacteriota bacterium TaxID=2212470 RepID=A0A956SIA1_UNCEI|nr:HEAT repeat domain-containing protein [Candidatus Eisenbacteria bacterium]
MTNRGLRPRERDLYELLGADTTMDSEHEVYVRFRAWHESQHATRSEDRRGRLRKFLSSVEVEPESSFPEERALNVERLEHLLPEEDQSKRIWTAEVARERRDFDRALELTEARVPSELVKLTLAIRFLARRQNSRIEVFEPEEQFDQEDLAPYFDELSAGGPDAKNAVRVLAKLNAEATTAALVRAVSSSNDPPSIEAALEELDRREFPKIADLAVGCLSSSSDDIRSQAAELLSRKGSAEHAAPLCETLLRDVSAEVRGDAARALDRIRHVSSIPALRTAQSDPDARVRQEVASALSSIGPPETTDALLEALRDTDEKVRWTAAFALGRADHAVVETLIGVMAADSCANVRERAATALGYIGDRRAVGPLTTVAEEDPDPMGRKMAVNALGKIRA